jgi:hypothetical protein
MSGTYNITTSTRTPNRRVTRFTKVIILLILSPFLIAAFVGAGIGVARAIHGSQGSSTTVSDFNDGFATSKQDDCQQGYQPACEWLKHNH